MATVVFTLVSHGNVLVCAADGARWEVGCHHLPPVHAATLGGAT